MQINQFTIFNKCLKTMRKPFGYKQAFLIRCGENFTVPPQKSGRAISDIYGDIINLALKATDDFAFRVRRILVMEAADSTFFHCMSVVDLGDSFFQPGCPEIFGAKEAREETPFICDGLPLHNPKPFKERWMEVESFILFYFQIFHLALPSFHILLRYSISRRVSMQAQKPRCLKTIN